MEGPGCAGEALEGGAGEDADVEGGFGVAGWAADADFDLVVVWVGHGLGFVLLLLVVEGGVIVEVFLLLLSFFLVIGMRPSRNWNVLALWQLFE